MTASTLEQRFLQAIQLSYQFLPIGIVDLDVERSEISGIADLSDLELSASSRAALQNELSVAKFFPRMARRIEIRHLSP